MAMSSAPDITVQITVPGNNSKSSPIVSAERRVTPSWTIQQLKGKLEPVTGVPVSSQVLRTRNINGSWIALDEESALVGDARWSLHRGSEIEVIDSRPVGLRENFSDVSSVEKYQMPEAQYEELSDSVLAWKKRQKLGRFDPNTKSAIEVANVRRSKDEQEISARGIKVDDRCRIGNDDGRRGVVRFVGAIEGLGGEREAGCIWIGIELDEPVGRNDGSIQVDVEGGQKKTRRIFQCKDKFGILARPERVDVGYWPSLNDLEVDDDMEEI